MNVCCLEELDTGLEWWENPPTGDATPAGKSLLVIHYRM